MVNPRTSRHRTCHRRDSACGRRSPCLGGIEFPQFSRRTRICVQDYPISSLCTQMILKYTEQALGDVWLSCLVSLYQIDLKWKSFERKSCLQVLWDAELSWKEFFQNVVVVDDSFSTRAMIFLTVTGSHLGIFDEPARAHGATSIHTWCQKNRKHCSGCQVSHSQMYRSGSSATLAGVAKLNGTKQSFAHKFTRFILFKVMVAKSNYNSCCSCCAISWSCAVTHIVTPTRTSVAPAKARKGLSIFSPKQALVMKENNIAKALHIGTASVKSEFASKA